MASADYGQNKLTWIIYFIAFAEGFSVIAFELAGVKRLAPFYGSSMTIWVSVLIVTLSGIAVGYYAGGRIAESKRYKFFLYAFLLAASFSVVFLYAGTSAIVGSTLKWPPVLGILITCSFLLLFPMMCYGVVSPLLIRMCWSVNNDSGQVAGNIYAVSTAGGVIACFITGFIFLPFFGVHATFYIISSCTTLAVILMALSWIARLDR